MSYTDDLLDQAGQALGSMAAELGLAKAHAVGVERERDDALRAAADLRDALIEARTDLADWAAYASEDLQEKWDLAGDLARIDTLLAREDIARIPATTAADTAAEEE